MMTETDNRTFHILLVEDSPGDIRLTQEALREEKMPCTLDVVRDGVEATAFLQREGEYADAARPDLILLDLNIPRKDGREVLAEIKADEKLKQIPVVVLTTSRSNEDIVRCYDLHANCYINKPVDFEEFISMVKSVGHFWFRVVKLPSGEKI
ncbi:response regulator [Desulfobacterales bacterium HSG2]|nr:response regulator [Desulfobacterales bacterium HSG2]